MDRRHIKHSFIEKWWAGLPDNFRSLKIGYSHADRKNGRAEDNDWTLFILCACVKSLESRRIINHESTSIKHKTINIPHHVLCNWIFCVPPNWAYTAVGTRFYNVFGRYTVRVSVGLPFINIDSSRGFLQSLFRVGSIFICKPGAPSSNLGLEADYLETYRDILRSMIMLG